MDIAYTVIAKSSDYWDSKGYGAIFVKEEKDIPKVLEILVEQDDYWESDNSKNIIKVLPENPDPRKLQNEIEYVGKRDIYDLDEFYKKLEEFKIDVFIIWSRYVSEF